MSDIKMIDKYRIVSVVGEGGMGKVYRAVHPTLKKDIIIKRLSISSKKVLSERFRREARIMMDFHHESIVSVHDHFKHGTSYYIAMEFVDGVSLDELIEKKKKIPPLAAALIFREISKGLKYAHDKGVIHRDIKPSNVLLSKDGEVKLFDFGIATIEEDEDEKDLTKTGMMMGTPSYMSPEQLSDAKRVDKRSDIYSMGVLLYQMLTGKKAYPGNFSSDTIRKISKGIYEKPKKSVPGLPRFFEKILRKAMHHKANSRYRDLDPVIHKLSRHLAKYKTQDEIHKALKIFLNEAPGCTSAFEKIPSSKRARIVLFAGIAVLVLLGTIGAFFVRYTPLPGIFWELFASKERGSLEIQVAVPPGYFKNLSDVYGQTKLTLHRGKTGNTPAKDEVFIYRLAPIPDVIQVFGGGQKNPTTISTGTLYLPSGDYTLELAAETEKYAAAFYLNPLEVQKQIPDSPEKKKIISFTLIKQDKAKIPVVQTIRDSVSKIDITGITKIYYFVTSYWVEWKYAKGALPAGQSQKLRYEAENYFPKEVEVMLAEGLDILKLDVDLQKIPGKVILSSDTEGLEILFDNSRVCYIGEKDKSFVTLGRTQKGEKSFPLNEGEYVLTLKKDDKTFNNYPFSVKSGSFTLLYVRYNAQANQINISR